MVLQEILSQVQLGKLSISEAEQLINELRPPSLRKPGRPRKTKCVPKKIGRPRKLSTYEKKISIMTTMCVLDLFCKNWSSSEKKQYIVEHFRISEKQAEAHRTELNKRIKNKEVWLDQITGQIGFFPEVHLPLMQTARIGDEASVRIRECHIGKYLKHTPK